MDSTAAVAIQTPVQASRLRTLQALGVFCGFAADAWLGGAEAPIKVVNAGVSPITVSLIMVAGVSSPDGAYLRSFAVPRMYAMMWVRRLT